MAARKEGETVWSSLKLLPDPFQGLVDVDIADGHVPHRRAEGSGTLCQKNQVVGDMPSAAT